LRGRSTGARRRAASRRGGGGCDRSDGGVAAFVETDVTDNGSVSAWSRVRRAFGRLDIAFNNADLGEVSVTIPAADEAIFDQ
jgi:NAD(P)-dependent dehydrogenase (short-subunit alcohol dehydrogenase family)